MKYNKHIVLLTPGFAMNEDDTTCIPTLQAYVESFSSIHPEIKLSIITFQYPFFHKHYKWKSVDIYSCGGKNRQLPVKRITWKRVFGYFKKIDKTCKVDFIHSFWLFDCALIGNRLAKKAGLPHTITLMGQDAKPRNKYLRWIDLSKCTTVCLSENHKAIFEKTSGISTSKIIPWGVNPADFQFSLNQSREIDIIGIGSFIELKNYILFIKIIEELKHSKEDIQVLLIGGGVQHEMLQHEIIKSGLRDNIMIMGQLPRQEVLKWMGKSKILLHTSVYESQGYVFFEAMQLGLKIVSFNIGSAKASDNWFVTSNKNEMKEALLRFLSASTEIKIEQPPLISETVQEYYKLLSI